MVTRATSIHVYRQILAEGLLPKKRLEVYKFVYNNGPCTAIQIEVGLGDKHAHKRTSELREQGALLEVDEGPCPITGRYAILWETTNSLPCSYKPLGSRKPRKELEAENAKLRRLLERALDKLNRTKQ